MFLLLKLGWVSWSFASVISLDSRSEFSCMCNGIHSFLTVELSTLIFPAMLRNSPAAHPRLYVSSSRHTKLTSCECGAGRELCFLEALIWAFNRSNWFPRLCSFAQKKEIGLRYPISGDRLPYITNSDTAAWILLFNLICALWPAIYFSFFTFDCCVTCFHYCKLHTIVTFILYAIILHWQKCGNVITKR